MQIQRTDISSSVSAVYAAAASAPAVGDFCAEVPPEESLDIEAFNPEKGSSAASLDVLYQQKSQTETAVGDIRERSREAQEQVIARKDEIIKEQQDPEQNGETQAEYAAAQAECEEASQAQAQARQELQQLNQEALSNTQALSSNSQQKQQVSGELSAAQSELASLTPPSQPQGDDEAAQADYQSQLNDYNARKSELESRISSLQQQQQQLEAEAQKLEAEKTQIAQAQQQARSEMQQQEQAQQAAQAKIAELQQTMAQDSPELQQAFQEDDELFELEHQQSLAQSELSVKETELSQIQGIIDTLEAQEVQDNPGRDGELLQSAMNRGGVDDEEVTVVNGTDGDAEIDVTSGADGSYRVRVNGEESVYSAEEAKRLIIEGQEGQDSIALHYDKDNMFGELAPEIDTSLMSVEQIDYLLSQGAELPEARRSGQAAIYISGGADDDIITADENVQTQLYITGDAGDDQIRGGSAADVIIDSQGSNTVDGAGGDDRIFTGEGGDAITDNQGSNAIYSGGGDDEITVGGSGRTVTHSGGGNDHIRVLDGDHVIYSEDGNDVIEGGDGREFVYSGDGDDIVRGRGGADVIFTGGDNDYVDGGGDDDFINLGSGDDKARGRGGNDVVFGLDGNDEIYGDEGQDTLVTGAGDDIADGGADDDTVRCTDSERGRDTLLNPEAGDDVKVLEPLEVPDSFKVASTALLTMDMMNEMGIPMPQDVEFALPPEAAAAFQGIIADNLQAFAAIEPGQAMLQAIADTEHEVTFHPFFAENGSCAPADMFAAEAQIETDDDGQIVSCTPGAGTDSTVQINPAHIELSGQSADPEDIPYREQNTMVVMGHELGHAYDNATGTVNILQYNNDTGEVSTYAPGMDPIDIERQASRDIIGSELQAVGLYPENLGLPNTYGTTENDYREFFHMALRTSYKDPLPLSAAAQPDRPAEAEKQDQVPADDAAVG